MQCLVSPEAEFREIPVFDNGAKITLAARRAEALTSAVAEIKQPAAARKACRWM